MNVVHEPVVPARPGAPAEPSVEQAGIGRRGFLRRAGLGVATVLVASDAVVGYRAYDQGVLSEQRGPAFRALDDWQSYAGPRAAVAAAVLAANAHNTQPWSFAVSDDHIDVYADPSRRTGANDALDRELDVSLGCALENLVLAAAAHGFATDVVLAPNGDPNPVATVGLRTASATTSELYRAIGTRRSNRSEYHAETLPMSTLTAMSALVDASVVPARLTFVTADAARTRFGELLVEATQAHVADEEQSRASAAWWRSSWDAIQRHKDGLNIDGVGLSPLVRTLGKILPATTRTANDKTFVELTKTQVGSAPVFGVVTVEDPWSRQQQLAGGRLVQRLHLWAAAHDLGFQHMNQITEQIDRDRQLGRASRFAGPLAELVGDGALVAFRIGHPKRAALASPRRPVEEVLR